MSTACLGKVGKLGFHATPPPPPNRFGDKLGHVGGWVTPKVDCHAPISDHIECIHDLPSQPLGGSLKGCPKAPLALWAALPRV